MSVRLTKNPKVEGCGSSCAVWRNLQGGDQLCPYMQLAEAEEEKGGLSEAMRLAGELASAMNASGPTTSRNYYTAVLGSAGTQLGLGLYHVLLGTETKALYDSESCPAHLGASTETVSRADYRRRLLERFPESTVVWSGVVAEKTD